MLAIATRLREGDALVTRGAFWIRATACYKVKATAPYLRCARLRLLMPSSHERLYLNTIVIGCFTRNELPFLDTYKPRSIEPCAEFRSERVSVPEESSDAKCRVQQCNFVQLPPPWTSVVWPPVGHSVEPIVPECIRREPTLPPECPLRQTLVKK